jgi:hypothetical protein
MNHLPHTLSTPLTDPQRTKANDQAIESLAPRIKSLAKTLCARVSEDDTGEKSRRDELER